MHELSSLDVYVLTQELQRVCTDAFVDKVFAPSPHDIVLQLRGTTKSLVRFIVPSVFYVARAKEAMPDTPSSWCNNLRKLVSGMKITLFEQPHSERIIHLQLEKGPVTRHIYFEFYAKGNVVVTDSEGVAKLVLYKRALKTRAIMPGKPYTLPVGKDPFHMSESEFVKRVTASGKATVEWALATAGSLGKLYARELCARAGIDPTERDVTAERASALYTSLVTLLETDPSPCVVLEDGRLVDAYPFRFSSFQEETTQEAATYSEAIDRVFRTDSADKREQAITRIVGDAQARLEKTIQAQRKSISKLETQQRNAQRVGKLLYEDFTTYESYVKEFQAARKEGKAAIDKLMKKYLQVKAYKPDKGEIVVEF